MKTDNLERRTRFAPPQPVDERIEIVDADMAIFDAIQRHGPLPTPYLHMFAKSSRGNLQAHKHRLTQLYNGTKDGKRYLTRPPQQFQNIEARYQPMIYDLAPAALSVLDSRGLRHIHSPARGDHFLHRFMTACASASFELGASERGIRYIHKEEILTRAPHKAFFLPVSGFEQKALIADDLFGLEYPGKGFRFFAVEIDRNTESIARKDLSQNAFAKKFNGYGDILASRVFRERWSIPNLTILTLTTNEQHARNLLAYLKEQGRKLTKFAFKSDPTFGTPWRVPRKPLEVFTPWSQAEGTLDISQA